MKKAWQTIQMGLISLSIWFITLPVLADLPTPPAEDMMDGSHDMIDVGGSMLFRVCKYTCLVIGVGILIGAAAGIVKAFHTSHERQDLGHFFKWMVVGLVASAIGIALVYVGYTIIPTSG